MKSKKIAALCLVGMGSIMLLAIVPEYDTHDVYGKQKTGATRSRQMAKGSDRATRRQGGAVSGKRVPRGSRVKRKAPTVVYKFRRMDKDKRAQMRKEVWAIAKKYPEMEQFAQKIKSKYESKYKVPLSNFLSHLDTMSKEEQIAMIREKFNQIKAKQARNGVVAGLRISALVNKIKELGLTKEFHNMLQEDIKTVVSELRLGDQSKERVRRMRDRKKQRVKARRARTGVTRDMAQEAAEEGSSSGA